MADLGVRNSIVFTVVVIVGASLLLMVAGNCK